MGCFLAVKKITNIFRGDWTTLTLSIKDWNMNLDTISTLKFLGNQERTNVFITQIK